MGTIDEQNPEEEKDKPSIAKTLQESNEKLKELIEKYQQQEHGQQEAVSGH